MKISKIGLKELAAVLTEKHGLEPQDAEKFAKTMFDVLNNGLHYEKIVKLKGLGTFKITNVSARKSIDVNTGSPIEIAEREKINFIPDATMKDLINRPFSQFETVVLNDGVEFPDLKDKDGISGDVDIENENPAQAVTVPFMNTAKNEIENEKTRGFEKEEESLDKKYIKNKVDSDIEKTEKSKEQEDVSGIESQQEEDSVAVGKQTEDEEVSDQKIIPLVDFTSEDDDAEAVSVNENIQNSSEKWTNNHFETERENLSEINGQLRDKLKLFKKIVSILGVISFLLLIACCVGAFYVSYQFSMRDNRIQHLEAQMQIHSQVFRSGPIQRKKQDGKESLQESNRIDKDASHSQPEKNNINTEENKSTSLRHDVQSKKTVKQPSKPVVTGKAVLENKYDGDARVRTGAYNIIGIDQTVIVKKGQTLKSLSKFYLGSGMECYVQAVNGGVAEFKENQKIKIPKLKIKKK